MGPKKEQKPKVAPATLEAVTSTLGKLHELIKPKKDGVRSKPGDELNTENLTKGLDLLKLAVEELTNFIKKEQKEKEELVTKVRNNEDEVDAQKQKHLKGRFFITGADTLVKNKEQLEKDKKNLPDHIKALAKMKYNVEISEDEITTCYHLKKGGIVVYLKNQNQDSGFQILVNTIKSSKSIKDVNLYFNFMLTRKRNSLLFDIRQLRKEMKNLKYFTDENGNISVQAPNSLRRKRVTNVFDDKTGGMITWNVEEIKRKLKKEPTSMIISKCIHNLSL